MDGKCAGILDKRFTSYQSKEANLWSLWKGVRDPVSGVRSPVDSWTRQSGPLTVEQGVEGRWATCEVESVGT